MTKLCSIEVKFPKISEKSGILFIFFLKDELEHETYTSFEQKQSVERLSAEESVHHNLSKKTENMDAVDSPLIKRSKGKEGDKVASLSPPQTPLNINVSSENSKIFLHKQSS